MKLVQCLCRAMPAPRSDLQTRFNGNCDNGHSLEPFVGIGSACFTADRVHSEGPDVRRQPVMSGSMGKDSDREKCGPASIVDALVVIMVFA